MTTQDDELIIIEDSNDETIDLGESNLIDLDNSEPEELITLDSEKSKNTNKSEDLGVINIETNEITEEKSDNNDILDFSFDSEPEEKKEESSVNLENTTEKSNNIDLNLSLEENINLDEPKLDKIIEINAEKEESVETKEEDSNFGLDLEDTTEETLETEVDSTEDLNTILSGTILKLANRKEAINKKIENTKNEITDIEIEVKKLQDERKELLAEVRQLTSENKKIDENIENLEEMKIGKENKTIKEHNSNRKTSTKAQIKKEKIAA